MENMILHSPLVHMEPATSRGHTGSAMQGGDLCLHGRAHRDGRIETRKGQIGQNHDDWFLGVSAIFIPMTF